MDELAPTDGWVMAAILVRAIDYAAALVAMGGPLFLAAFRSGPTDALLLTRKLAVFAALVSFAVLALRFGIRAGRISGMGFVGATDVTMLKLLWESPMGTAALWKAAGSLMILAIVFKGSVGVFIGLLGALLIAVSYTFVGHSLSEPRWLLAALLTVHLLSVAFWVGALVPLYSVVNHAGSAALLHRFGVIASGTVTALVLVGLGFAWLMIGSVQALFTTAYGWTLLAKILTVAGLLGLAAKNKLQLVPALVCGDRSAAHDLTRSIRLEIMAVAFILVLTATLTTITVPPVNL